jgi:hypothetical protein
MDIRDFAEKYIKAEYDAFLKGDFTALAKVEDLSVIYHITPVPDTVGHEAHKQFIIDMRELIADLKLEFKYLTGEGNHFAMAFKSNYKVMRDKPGYLLPVGKKITEDFLFVYRMVKGKVREAWANGTFTVTD